MRAFGFWYVLEDKKERRKAKRKVKSEDREKVKNTCVEEKKREINVWMKEKEI